MHHRIKVLLSIVNYSVKKLSNLASSFSSSDTSWKNKTPITSTETHRMVIYLSKHFLQTQSFFIVWNQEQMIFVLGKTEWKEWKLLNFKRSSKIFTMNTKAISNYRYVMQPSMISFHWSLWYQLIGTKRNPLVSVNLQSPVIYSNDASTLSLTSEIC